LTITGAGTVVVRAQQLGSGAIIPAVPVVRSFDVAKADQAITFAAGELTKTVTVAITNDTVFEATETFGLVVQRNSTDADTTFLAKSTFSILDDDPQPTTYALTPGTTSVNEAAGTVTFTITRSGGTPAETIFASTTTGEGSANLQRVLIADDALGWKRMLPMALANLFVAALWVIVKETFLV
jgi:hypothetical protein